MIIQKAIINCSPEIEVNVYDMEAMLDIISHSESVGNIFIMATQDQELDSTHTNVIVSSKLSFIPTTEYDDSGRKAEVESVSLANIEDPGCFGFSIENDSIIFNRVKNPIYEKCIVATANPRNIQEFEVKLHSAEVNVITELISVVFHGKAVAKLNSSLETAIFKVARAHLISYMKHRLTDEEWDTAKFSRFAHELLSLNGYFLRFINCKEVISKFAELGYNDTDERYKTDRFVFKIV